jgi:flagellar biosynthesis protein FlhF
MDIKSYRARSVQEALAMVRADLGPDAAVLHTREVPPGMMRLLGAVRQIEVIATAEAESVPSRMPQLAPTPVPVPVATPRERRVNPRHRFRSQMADSATVGMDLLGDAPQGTSEDAVARVYQQLVKQQWPQELAAELVQRVLQVALDEELTSQPMLQARVARLLEEDLPACRPIQVAPNAQRVVALVGPTGVGKTTTIAKLAANFRLRQRKRVGLITVDTYRIAAVEQLRTYADLIDLPMEVVSNPREMREAVTRMANVDLLLIDTAGRSPRDESKLQELQTVLAEAQPHEVHLVLSTVASAATLVDSVKQFYSVGATSLVLTKLDEAAGLGNVAALLRSAALPVSYLTHGQNVPADIAPAERRRLARAMVGLGEPRHA